MRLLRVARDEVLFLDSRFGGDDGLVIYPNPARDKITVEIPAFAGMTGEERE